MLTESIADPRRANLLTISSMSGNFDWLEEFWLANEISSRPSSELEAEILRLTTRLMMKEEELQQVKSQMKSQTTRHQDQLSNLYRKMEEQEEQMKMILVQKDDEMQAIVSQLLLFEDELRREQTRIELLLSEKDKQIEKQKIELEKLKNAVKQCETISIREQFTDDCIQRKASSVRVCATLEDNHKISSIESYKKFLQTPVIKSQTDSDSAVKKLKEGLIQIRAIQDLTNIRSMRSEKTLAPEMKICQNDIFGEKRRVPSKTPQKVKDLKTKRVNPIHKSHHHHRPIITREFCGQVIL